MQLETAADIPFVQRQLGRTPEEAQALIEKRRTHFEAERAKAMDLIATLPADELQRLYRLLPWRRDQEQPGLASVTDRELELCIELMHGVRRTRERG